MKAKGAKSDLKAKMSLAPNVRDLAKLTSDEIVADLEYLAHKHKEMFKKPSDVFKLIKEVKDNPTFFYKNNRMDIALIAKRLKDDKLGKLGINKDSGEVRHITKVKSKDLRRLEKVSKKNTKENVGIIQTFIQPGSKNDNSLNGLPDKLGVESPYSTQPVLSKDAEPTAHGAKAHSLNDENSTQTKPKKSLIERLNEDIKAKNEFRANLLENLTKELKAKNGTQNLKSIKEKLDEKIKADIKAKNEFMQDYKKALDEKVKTKVVKNKALSADDLHNIISKWDLSKETNANSKQKIIASQISNEEALLLKQEFNFKENKPLVREIDSQQIIHTLKNHGDETKENLRGQEAITLKDISDYLSIIKNADLRIKQDNGRILYAKQVNGNFIIVEEALTGQDKLRFFNMWKQKGKLNKEVLLSHSQRPNTNSSLKPESHMPNNTKDILPQNEVSLVNENLSKKKR